MTSAGAWRRPGVLFAFAASVIATSSIAILRSELFAGHPDILAWAVTFDLTLTIPLLYYLVVIRTGHARPLTIAPVFVVCTIVAALVLPRGHQQKLHDLRFVIAPLEVIAIVLLIRKLAAMRRRETDSDPLGHIEAAAQHVFGSSRIAGFVATEVAIVWYALFGWNRKSCRAGWVGAVVTHLRHEAAQGRIAYRPPNGVPHLLLTASLEPATPPITEEEARRVARFWWTARQRAKRLRYNHKIDTFARVQAELRAINEFYLSAPTGAPVGTATLDLDVVVVKPRWLCGTFAFHPILGFRTENQAGSIAHGCATTFSTIARIILGDEPAKYPSWPQSWGMWTGDLDLLAAAYLVPGTPKAGRATSARRTNVRSAGKHCAQSLMPTYTQRLKRNSA